MSKRFTEISRLSTDFSRTERRLQKALSCQVSEHPGRRLVLKGLRSLTLKELAILYTFCIENFELSQGDLVLEIPETIRFEVILTYEARVRNLDSLSKLRAENYRLWLVHSAQDNFFLSRGVDIIYKTLKVCRVYLQDPPEPRKTVFRRGYRDQGSRVSIDVLARRQADKEGAEQEEVGELRRHQQAVLNDLRVATAILEAEARGIPTEEIEAQLDASFKLTFESELENLPSSVKVLPDKAEDIVQSLRSIPSQSIKKIDLGD